ncbi:GIY-YIG nuclease family protein [Patescibacteria group bacterium]|nr:MAG: GIY-YIG nuclease family protein [Patescibacteria group bacterium]
MAFYVYILELKNKALYTGFTGNIKTRYNQHINGLVASTRGLRPLKLVHYECYILEEDARRREKFLKTSDGKMFLNRQLSSYLRKIGRYKEL